MKNMFRFDDEMAAQQFHYRTVMVNWLYTPGLTFRDLARNASQLWDDYQQYAYVVGVGGKAASEPASVW
jgi:hypothetical protein